MSAKLSFDEIRKPRHPPYKREPLNLGPLLDEEENMLPYDVIVGDDGYFYAEMAIDGQMLGPFEDSESAEYAAVRYLQHQ